MNNTPEKERTPVQKKLAKGLETSLRITWEEVAAAVAANPVRPRSVESGSSGKSTRSNGPCPDRRRTPWRLSIKNPRRRIRTSSVAVITRCKDPKVAPRPPGVVLASQSADKFTPTAIVPSGDKTGRRAALAKWLAGPDNPLTARVIVNRLWQHHFGRGIVATPSDFGVRGEPPTHPELLDWLASELVAQDWRLKPLHRLMVTSATYRLSNKANPKLAAEDPENTLFGRANRRRLDAEGVRDAMLAVSGELNPKMGGPGVLAPLEKEVEDLIFTEAEVVDTLARGPRSLRARQAVALSVPQTKRAVSPLGSLRRARYPNGLPATRDQHSRVAGPVTLEQRVCRRKGEGPGRPDRPRRRRRHRPADSTGLPTRACSRAEAG